MVGTIQGPCSPRTAKQIERAVKLLVYEAHRYATPDGAAYHVSQTYLAIPEDCAQAALDSIRAATDYMQPRTTGAK